MTVASTADRIVILAGCRAQSLALGDPIRGYGALPRQSARMGCNDAANAELSAMIGPEPGVRQREQFG